jgi:thiol-disulfide isomerase/thioredoxin
MLWTNDVRTALLAIVLLLPAGAAIAQARPAKPEAPEGDAIDRRQLEKLPPADRVFLDELVGYAPPAFSEGLTWVGADRGSWDVLRGMVVVLQTWSTSSAQGRRAPELAIEALAGLDAKSVQLITVHTPDGAADLDRYLERKPVAAPIVVDARGAFCDELGAYRRPVNVVVDRNGIVRAAGLTWKGLSEVVRALVKQEYDPEAKPKERGAAASAEFPPFSGEVANARDVRGQRAPELSVQQWLNGRPIAEGKVVIVDFWATWCGPCVASIPHMNQLAERFKDDVAIVGLSDESSGSFADGMRKLESQRITLDTFRYAVALDPSATMKKALRVTGIPHAIVMSSDWTVRWQGHPTSLSEATLEKIVKANGGADGARAKGRNRWTGKK